MVQNCSYFFSNLFTFQQFSVISILIALIFTVYLHRLIKHQRFSLVALGVFFLGAIINAFDRLADGCVSDYLDFFGLFKYNIADLMITVSSIYMVYLLIFTKHREENRE